MALNQTNVQPQYEDYEPPFDWDQDEGGSTLLVMLPGFRKEQLKVQTTSTGLLKLSGERKISDKNKSRRFYKELPIPPGTDTNSISAKFEGGILYVRVPKLITSVNPTPTTPSEPPKPQIQQQQPKPNETPKPTPTPTPTSTPTPTPTPKDDSEKKQHVKEKERATKESGDATRGIEAKKGEELAKAMDKRTPTMEMVSRQTQEYKSAVYGMVEEIKRQKKLANLVLIFFFVLLFVLYVKNAIKSSFGGPKNQEL